MGIFSSPFHVWPAGESPPDERKQFACLCAVNWRMNRLLCLPLLSSLFLAIGAVEQASCPDLCPLQYQHSLQSEIEDANQARVSWSLVIGLLMLISSLFCLALYFCIARMRRKAALREFVMQPPHREPRIDPICYSFVNQAYPMPITYRA